MVAENPVLLIAVITTVLIFITTVAVLIRRHIAATAPFNFSGNEKLFQTQIAMKRARVIKKRLKMFAIVGTILALLLGFLAAWSLLQVVC